MNTPASSRREFLKKITSLGVMGTAAYLRSPMSIASAKTAEGSLAQKITGQVVKRSDENYEAWRQAMMWHLSKPNRKPDYIVQAKSDTDVIEAVNFARSNKQKIAIRSSGHNSTGAVLRDGGVLLDLSSMREVNIDPARSIATVQPALWATQLLIEAEKHKLAFPAAHCPSVAVGGYVMGGGIGWNHAHWGGVACHSIRSMEMVTADGNKITASPTENKDLYWAARGVGPGFFAAVTRFELQLYKAPEVIMGSMYIHPLDNLSVVTDILEKLLEVKDERVEILLLFMHNHHAPPDTPPEQAKICFIGVNAFAESESEAKEMLRPFSESTLATESVFKQEYQKTSFQKLYNPENVDTGLGRYAVDNEWTNDFSGALHSVAEHFKSSPSTRSHVVASLGMNSTLHKDASFSRMANHYLSSYLVWDEEKDDETNYSWLAETNSLLSPFSEGHYVNEISGDRHPQRYRECFSEESWKRMQVLREKYDPTGVFHNYLGHS
jgi:FAD/FMN-containing dehydrogenase